MFSYFEGILLTKSRIAMKKTMIDSSTAVSYINSMGGRSLTCNQITRELWVWCASHGIWLSAAHIPGKENVLSR